MNDAHDLAGDKADTPAPAPALNTLAIQDFKSPAVLLSGTVDNAMYKDFRAQLDRAPQSGLVVIEISTLGGDPEVARMMGLDVVFHSELNPDRRIVFLGKAMVYSAGATFMSFFARANRYLTRGTRVMIHERKLTTQLHVEGPLTTCGATLRATLHEIEASIAIQNEGFEYLVRGSKVKLEDLMQRATVNWYLEAQEARDLGLVEAVI